MTSLSRVFMQIWNTLALMPLKFEVRLSILLLRCLIASLVLKLGRPKHEDQWDDSLAFPIQFWGINVKSNRMSQFKGHNLHKLSRAWFHFINTRIMSNGNFSESRRIIRERERRREGQGRGGKLKMWMILVYEGGVSAMLAQARAYDDFITHIIPCRTLVFKRHFCWVQVFIWSLAKFE